VSLLVDQEWPWVYVGGLSVFPVCHVYDRFNMCDKQVVPLGCCREN